MALPFGLTDAELLRLVAANAWDGDPLVRLLADRLWSALEDSDDGEADITAKQSFVARYEGLADADFVDRIRESEWAEDPLLEALAARLSPESDDGEEMERAPPKSDRSEALPAKPGPAPLFLGHLLSCLDDHGPMDRASLLEMVGQHFPGKRKQITTALTRALRDGRLSLTKAGRVRRK